MFSWGCGEHGQLGHPEHEDHYAPKLVEAMQRRHLTHVACGAIHSALLTDSGDVFVTGFGEYLYGKEGDYNFQYLPRQIELPKKIAQIACGQSHVLALAVDNDVYSWGSNGYGQLGLGDFNNARMPRLCLHAKEIAAIAAGRYHSAALSHTGMLFTWGCGESGQLGHDSDEHLCTPQVVTALVPSVCGQVSCGEHHTCALTSSRYSKNAEDVQEWLRLEQTEFGKKVATVTEHKQQGKPRGLSRRDLLRIQRWRSDQVARRRLERHAESRKDQRKLTQKVSAIQMGDEIRGEVVAELLRKEELQLASSRQKAARRRRLRSAVPRKSVVAGMMGSGAMSMGIPPRPRSSVLGAAAAFGRADSRAGSASPRKSVFGGATASAAPRKSTFAGGTASPSAASSLGTTPRPRWSVFGAAAGGLAGKRASVSAPRLLTAPPAAASLAAQVAGVRGNPQLALSGAICGDTLVFRRGSVYEAESSSDREPEAEEGRRGSGGGDSDVDAGLPATTAAADGRGGVGGGRARSRPGTAGVPVLPLAKLAALRGFMGSTSSARGTPTGSVDLLGPQRVASARPASATSSELRDLQPPASARAAFQKETAGPLRRMTDQLRLVLLNETGYEQAVALRGDVLQQRLDHDGLKAQKLRAEREVARLTQELKALEAQRADTRFDLTDDMHRIKQLDMKLDTVNIKIAEAQNHRESYELSLQYLKDEEMEVRRQTESLADTAHSRAWLTHPDTAFAGAWRSVTVRPMRRTFRAWTEFARRCASTTRCTRR